MPQANSKVRTNRNLQFDKRLHVGRTPVTNLFFPLFLTCEAFGFCEYKEPESTLRALRLLHELLLGDKKLLVKVDAKTKAQLDEWKAKKKSANGVYVV